MLVPGVNIALILLAAGPVADPGLEAEHLYHGVGQPIPLVATGPPGVELLDLMLMDETGLVLAVPRSTPPGAFDLAEVMPAATDVVRERRRACYLQLAIDNEPIGAALVLQPMLTRRVPVTQVEPHPVTGQAHTKIVDWQWESEVPPPATADDTQTPGQVGGDGTSVADASPAEPTVTFSGLRIYPDHDVVLETTLGEMRIALSPESAPNTAWSFRELCAGGFYRGVTFHRVVPFSRDGDPFVIQAGDPGGTGEGGPGYWLPIEPSDLEHDFGVISMARADHPDSAGSQFFICLSRKGTARLDGQYCAFGYAVGGAETIVAIATTELADVARGRPVDPPVITGTRFVPAPPRVPGMGRPDQRVTVPVPTKPVKPPRVPR